MEDRRGERMRRRRQVVDLRRLRAKLGDQALALGLLRLRFRGIGARASAQSDVVVAMRGERSDGKEADQQ